MSVSISENDVRLSGLGNRKSNGPAPLVMPLSKFPKYLSMHLAEDPSTPSLENFARQYVLKGLPIEWTWPFIHMVCAWGGNSLVLQNLKRLNRERQPKFQNALREIFSECVELMRHDEYSAAITRIMSVKGLACSFGSKHLKFLNPQKAVVLDSIISKQLGYPLSPNGYVSFLTDCFAVRDSLNKMKVHTKDGNRRWRVSDVEMAIYSKLRS